MTTPATWVLLRGLMREQRHWGGFPAQFQAAVRAPVICLDFAGNGSQHHKTSASSVPAMLQDLRAQLREQGHRPPYRILALSLGAMVAVDWASHYPAELETVVLINTSLAPYNPFYHRLRPANYVALIRFLLAGSLAQRERLILRLTSGQSGSESADAIVEQWAAYARECTITRGNILRQLFAAASYRAVTGTPIVPLLLLGGQQDQLVNVQCSITLAQRWHSQLRLHPTAGHDLPLDDAAWVIRQITQWLSGQE